jgi:hypothetical protein
LREVLGEFPIPTPQHATVLVHDHRRAASGTLIEGEDRGQLLMGNLVMCNW